MTTVTIQNSDEPPSSMPCNDTIMSWASATIPADDHPHPKELTIRFVSRDEMQSMNLQFRGIDKATNVLSFPDETPSTIQSLTNEPTYLGDIAISLDVALDEASQQQKQFEHHLAHLVIHGCLHLLGYDHISDADAEEMEALEVHYLSAFDIPNPYQSSQMNEVS